MSNSNSMRDLSFDQLLGNYHATDEYWLLTIKEITWFISVIPIPFQRDLTLQLLILTVTHKQISPSVILQGWANICVNRKFTLIGHTSAMSNDS